jgi:RimJ/RimL family protein N-acetyltransferase
MTLQTERLILRQWTADDFEPFAALHADPAVMEFLAVDGKPLTRFQSWQGFCAMLGHWQVRGFGIFAVIERSSGEFVGRVGPWYAEGWPDFEIIWTIRPKFWGRGYATEAARRCVEHAFVDLGRDYVSSFIEPANVRSVRVAERLGERPGDIVTLPYYGEAKPLIQYTLHRRDWNA